MLLNANCDLKLGDFGITNTKSKTDFMTEYHQLIIGDIMTIELLVPVKNYVSLTVSLEDSSLGFLKSDKEIR